ncbi:phage baseplate assembly protein [Salmonella enterica]|uniref:Baseplate protein n=2 Tax=Salmonella enterica TaxID=28901 RepID=A0A379QIJ2_SALER|nr:baseplate protein [Salmonella enterica]ECC1654878.1 baseplate protein [Salmonella enterica subsp. salamae]ASG87615.1 baseplate protein [Salmonella enterica subsp. salamae serovar 55:k:z39 str. 1315K]ECD9413672.1 baseplate protein [Salmonella enterica subsp. salamae]ECF5930124.1 baseplate protein [Salmonella enterica subsp. salamae]ECG1248901.1 baseplate protein [Salmonella enterica subsp. salamae]
MTNHDVTLRINGQDFAGWTRVNISAGIDRISRNFDVEITRRWPQSSDITALEIPVVDGDSVEVLIGTDKVMTGYIDSTPIRYEASSVSTSISGRSKTEDLIDCSAPTQPGQFTNRTLSQIVTTLAQPFGVSVVSSTTEGSTLTSFQIDYGESVSEAINRLLSLEQVLAFDNADGALVLDTVGNERAVTALVLGQNIISADSQRDFSDRFSEYTVSGQRAGTDDDFAAATNSKITATVNDAAVTRYRPLIIKQCGNSTLATCKARAQYEQAHREGRTLETTYTVLGWRQGDGQLWQPNQRVVVWDPILGFDNSELVIAEVNYQLSDRGFTTRLRVGPRAAYMPEPKTGKRHGRGRHHNGGDF